MHIKVLGSGCAKCHSLEDKVRQVVEKNSIDAVITKVTDIQQIMSFGIMMTPGLVINEKVVSSGTVPKDDQILKWLKEAE
ncbi:MAG: thioredoxin family protein [bacterium]